MMKKKQNHSGVENDQQLISLWLYGKSEHTKRAYKAIITGLLKNLDNKPVHELTYADLVAFDEALTNENRSVNTHRQYVAAVKSFLSFATDQGYIDFNVGKAFKIAKEQNTLRERMLTLDEVRIMLTHAASKSFRNYMLIWLMYTTGGRASEIVNLCWKDVILSDDGVVIYLFGKGEKTRSVSLPVEDWNELMKLRGQATRDDPVFVSKFGKKLSYNMTWRIVRDIAQKSNIGRTISPHFWRHAHASHALAAGCPIDVLQRDLGHSNLATTGKYLHATSGRSSAKYLTRS